MTALQVRDFPDQLLEDLRKEASRQHRSVSQQTIYLIERGLSSRETFLHPDQSAHHELTAQEQRLNKRKSIFAFIDSFSCLSSDQLAMKEKVDREIQDERMQAMDRSWRVLQDLERSTGIA